MGRYQSYSDDFYVNMNLNTEMELPHSRETVLHYFEQVKKQFGIYSRKVEQPGGGYSVDHTATVILLDRNGQFSSTLSPEEGNQVALDKLKRITA